MIISLSAGFSICPCQWVLVPSLSFFSGISEYVWLCVPVLLACLALVLTGGACLCWKLGCNEILGEGYQERMVTRIHRRH